jgi:hypothetical protein
MEYVDIKSKLGGRGTARPPFTSIDPNLFSDYVFGWHR